MLESVPFGSGFFDGAITVLARHPEIDHITAHAAPPSFMPRDRQFFLRKESSETTSAPDFLSPSSPSSACLRIRIGGRFIFGSRIDQPLDGARQFAALVIRPDRRRHWLHLRERCRTQARN
jgi:hypothetical protein